MDARPMFHDVSLESCAVARGWCMDARLRRHDKVEPASFELADHAECRRYDDNMSVHVQAIQTSNA